MSLRSEGRCCRSSAPGGATSSVNCSTWGMRRRTACISTCTRSRRHTGTRTATAGFPKQGASLWFHLEGIGAIPAGLSDIRSSPHFELFPVRAERFETICAELDSTDKWLRNSIYQAGFEWIDAGLDVAFDADSRREYRAFADAAPQARAAAIAQKSEFADRAAN